MRDEDGDLINIEGISINVMYTSGSKKSAKFLVVGQNLYGRRVVNPWIDAQTVRMAVPEIHMSP